MLEHVKTTAIMMGLLRVNLYPLGLRNGLHVGLKMLGVDH